MSPPMEGREQLCTIVPLSTTRPRIVRPYNCEVLFDPPLPFPYQSPVSWAKADMIMCVAYHRLKLLHGGERDENGKRVYDIRVLNPDKMDEIRQCVRNAIGL